MSNVSQSSLSIPYIYISITKHRITMAFTDTRSWGISLGLRIPALFFNIFSIICFAVGFPIGMLI